MTVEEMNGWSPGTFVALRGIQMVSVNSGRLTSEMLVRPDLIAPNGYLHAGSIVTLADTSAGLGCWAHLPVGTLSSGQFQNAHRHVDRS